MDNVRLRCTILPTAQLSPVGFIVLLLEFAHLFNFVEVDDEAGFLIVQVLNALATENRRVFAAVEMLNSLLVLLAHVGSEVALVRLVILVLIWVSVEALLKVHTGQKRIPCHHLI